MPRFKVDKLIRDRLPEIMRKRGVQVHERFMEPEEFVARLKEKLLEEAGERPGAQSGGIDGRACRSAGGHL